MHMYMACMEYPKINKSFFVFHTLFWYVIELYNGYKRSNSWNVDEAPSYVDEADLIDVVVSWIPEKIPFKIKPPK